MGFREDTAALNRMTIQTVGSLLGLRLPPRGMIHCPFPDHNDRTPSFQVGNAGNRWVCYGCQRRGGPIDFVKIYHGTNFPDAKRWLAAHAGISTTSLRATSRHTKVRPIDDSSPSATDEAVESPPDTELYEALLRQAPLQASGMQYLLKRGLSKKIISDFRIGQLSDCTHLIWDIIHTYGYQRVDTAGLLTKSSTRRKWQSLFPPQSLLFPFFEDGHVVYLQVRRLFGSAVQGRWRNLNHRKRRIYNFDAIFNNKRTPFAICEGAIDTLSAIEFGYDAIGLMGVNMELKEEHMRRLRDKQVVILLDWDSMGETRSTKLQNELRRLGIASTRKRCPSPDVKDVNGYLMMTRAQA